MLSTARFCIVSGMSKTHLQTGVAVAVTLAVVTLFFIFANPFFFADAGPVQTPSASTGLVIQDESMGTGAIAQPGTYVTVNYTGRFEDGAVFDSSVGREPFSFMLGAGEVIEGWEQGVVGMQVGGKRLLIVPPALGYGPAGFGPIPPNATLVFEVELLSVQPASAAPAQ